MTNTNLHPYIGLGVTIIKDCMTKGLYGIIINTHDNGKYEIDFQNGFVGWYEFSEFTIN